MHKTPSKGYKRRTYLDYDENDIEGDEKFHSIVCQFKFSADEEKEEIERQSSLLMQRSQRSAQSPSSGSFMLTTPDQIPNIGKSHSISTIKRVTSERQPDLAKPFTSTKSSEDENDSFAWSSDDKFGSMREYPPETTSVLRHEPATPDQQDDDPFSISDELSPRKGIPITENDANGIINSQANPPAAPHFSSSALSDAATRSPSPGPLMSFSDDVAGYVSADEERGDRSGVEESGSGIDDTNEGRKGKSRARIDDSRQTTDISSCSSSSASFDNDIHTSVCIRKRRATSSQTLFSLLAFIYSNNDGFSASFPTASDPSIRPFLPATLNATLRPFQQEGVAWLMTLKDGGILADEMGCGKTIQTLAFLLKLKETREKERSAVEKSEGEEENEMEDEGVVEDEDEIEEDDDEEKDEDVSEKHLPHLIFCPNSTLHNWKTECDRFTPSLHAYVYHGSSKERITCRKEIRRCLNGSQSDIVKDVAIQRKNCIKKWKRKRKCLQDDANEEKESILQQKNQIARQLKRLKKKYRQNVIPTSDYEIQLGSIRKKYISISERDSEIDGGLVSDLERCNESEKEELDRLRVERQELSKRYSKIDVILAPYSLLSSKQDRGFLSTLVFEWLVLDESQMIKNVKTNRYKFINSLKTNHRLLLSGTPIQNDENELLATICLLIPSIINGRRGKDINSIIDSIFRDTLSEIQRIGEQDCFKYIDYLVSRRNDSLSTSSSSSSSSSSPSSSTSLASSLSSFPSSSSSLSSSSIIFHNSSIKTTDIEENLILKLLKSILSPLILRRTKDQVCQLPPKHRHYVPLPMTSTQSRLYQLVKTTEAMKASYSRREEEDPSGMLVDPCSPDPKGFKMSVGSSSVKPQPQCSSALHVLIKLRKAAIHPILLSSLYPEHTISQISASLPILHVSSMGRLFSEVKQACCLPRHARGSKEDFEKALGGLSDFEIHSALVSVCDSIEHHGCGCVRLSGFTRDIPPQGHEGECRCGICIVVKQLHKHLLCIDQLMDSNKMKELMKIVRKKVFPEKGKEEEERGSQDMFISTKPEDEDEEDGIIIDSDCCDPHPESSRYCVDEHSKEVFHASGREKVIIFSFFTSVLDIIECLLHHASIPFLRFDGSTPTEDREEILCSFNYNFKFTDPHVILISTRCGGAGINLFSASTVIFLDHDFNYAADLQAEDRAHRIGQTRPVNVIKLVSDSSVDQHILKMSERKAKLAAVMLEQEGGKFGMISNDEEDQKEISKIFQSVFED
ncbi:hypothetical protein ADUPG1_011946 [Aduncisulcus paluster]|uniref:Uncharacterized protein n=1 Tax=Aduncisulcus paluster TaxID=2918883 RepID=A0ABQ5JXT3_9EUKA|nr:hypothetical protein ADUPG1_011946 [Aduncisulcus paluster]